MSHLFRWAPPLFCGLIVGGCTEHVLLGRLPEEAGLITDSAFELDSQIEPQPKDAGEPEEVSPLDAGELLDAEPDAALRAELLANSVAHVTRMTGCVGECVDLEVRIHGGRRPYRVVWSDGESSLQRRLCPDAEVGLTVHVSDEDTPVLPDAGLGIVHLGPSKSITLSPAACTAEQGRAWRICVQPERVASTCSSAPTQEAVFLFPPGFRAGPEPRLILSFGGFLLPETILGFNTRDGCADAPNMEQLLAWSGSIFSPRFETCASALPLPYLHLRPTAAGTRVDHVEVCEACF